MDASTGVLCTETKQERAHMDQFATDANPKNVIGPPVTSPLSTRLTTYSLSFNSSGRTEQKVVATDHDLHFPDMAYDEADMPDGQGRSR